MVERLRRLEYVFERHPVYFVSACTFERRALLANSALHGAFAAFAWEGPRHGAWVGKYVLMPDHLHLFTALEDDKISLSDWMKSLKNALSKALRVEGIDAPHWQKGFFDHVLRGAESYSQKWAYVRENPVRAGLVKAWRDWAFAGEIHDLDYRRDRVL